MILYDRRRRVYSFKKSRRRMSREEFEARIFQKLLSYAVDAEITKMTLKDILKLKR